jgi:hypothetical protein
MLLDAIHIGTFAVMVTQQLGVGYALAIIKMAATCVTHTTTCRLMNAKQNSWVR